MFIGESNDVLEEYAKDGLRNFGRSRFISGMWHSCLLYIGITRIILLGDFVAGIPLAIAGLAVFLIHLKLDDVRKPTKKEQREALGLLAVAIIAIIFMVIGIVLETNREIAAKKADSVIEVQEKQ